MNILLIDDDSFLRDMYATKFTQEGFSVSVARNGEEGAKIFEDEGPFDVVLLDMIMPGITGVELIEKLKMSPKAKDVDFIVLSNQGEESDIDTAKKVGAKGYIIKAETIPSEVVSRVKEFTKA